MDRFERMECRPAARPENVICGSCYRITVLTEGLIRLEYSAEGCFEDRATQTVLNRDFAPAAFTVKETEEELQIFTSRIHMIYDKQEFSSHGLSLQVLGNISNYHSIWHYGEDFEDLGGTARTLDRVNGACALEKGLMAKYGFSVLDDSHSLILTDEGWVESRRKGIKDIYFWGYGHDYRQCLKDFYYLCGKTPMLPRFALGNWWSRYFEYTEESYRELMEQFDEEKIPFTVGVIDMDWHLVDVDPKYGSGWTGYTWNREFFPDPERFMKWLHERGMKVSLNLHPADGIRAYEEIYAEMAEAMGIDPATGEGVNFDITNPDFLRKYFDIVLHPFEEEGVDFWWIDWQQGTNCRIEGLDPLWMLNHYHYLDNGRDGKRPMTFSRYAGPGSHRYPVGFSGDTHITWDSLDFQPYFTATASNIGYGWWSHDIGGHMQGYRDETMTARWMQLGVFSPINRIHSTKDIFYSKEPWFFPLEIRRSMGTFLRLRHKLLPYLYTMNYRAYSQDLPIVEPMYYAYPEEPEAYEVKNQYLFGSELIAAPITRKNNPSLHVGKVKVWLPEGTYIDFFTGMIYKGGRMLSMFRDIQSMPVLAKAGAIVPMTDEILGDAPLSTPASLRILAFAGADGRFALYEDDNDTQAYKEGVCAVTEMEWSWQEKTFAVRPVKGEAGLIPEKRGFTLEIRGCTEAAVSVTKNGQPVSCTVSYAPDKGILTVSGAEAGPEDALVFSFGGEMALASNDSTRRIFDFLNQAEIPYLTKQAIYKTVRRYTDVGEILGALRAMDLEEDLFDCISEFLA